MSNYELGRLAAVSTEKSHHTRTKVTAAVATLAIGVTVAGLTVPNLFKNAKPETARSRVVTLEAMNEDSKPYSGVFAVDVTASNGFKELIVGNLPKLKVKLPEGAVSFDTSNGGYPENELGGTGVYSQTLGTVSGGHSDVIVVHVPNAYGGTYGGFVGVSPQHSSSGNINVIHNNSNS
jgi:hypothetical protein